MDRTAKERVEVKRKRSMPAYHADKPNAHQLNDIAAELLRALGETPVVESAGRDDDAAPPREVPLRELWNARERDELRDALAEVLRPRLAAVLAAAKQRM